MPTPMEDIVWLNHLEAAQEASRRLGVPIAIKVLGQGTDEKDDW